MKIKINRNMFAIIMICLLIAIGTILIIRDEVNEPDHGTIVELKYHPAYTTSSPQYITSTNSDGLITRTFIGTQQIYHPERYEVIYELFDKEKRKNLRGDCDVPASMWEKLKVGDEFANIN